MTTALLIATGVAASAFCPLMMWIQGRRGRAAGCWPPGLDRERPAMLAELRRRRAEVDALIAERAGEALPQTRPGS